VDVAGASLWAEVAATAGGAGVGEGASGAQAEISKIAAKPRGRKRRVVDFIVSPFVKLWTSQAGFKLPCTYPIINTGISSL
jgi:hypothetical protein